MTDLTLAIMAYSSAVLGTSACIIAIQIGLKSRRVQRKLVRTGDLLAGARHRANVLALHLHRAPTFGDLRADLYTAENEVALLRSKLTRSPGARAVAMAQRAIVTKALREGTAA